MAVDTTRSFPIAPRLINDAFDLMDKKAPDLIKPSFTPTLNKLDHKETGYIADLFFDFHQC